VLSGKGKDAGNPLKEIQKKFSTDKYEASKRAKEANRSSWIGRRFNYTNDYNLDAELNALAVQRSKEAASTIRSLENAADSAIVDTATEDASSLVVLEHKVKVCEQVVADLQEEINEYAEEGAGYATAIKLLENLKEKDLDPVALKKLKVTKDKISKIKTVTERAVIQERNKKESKKIAEKHTTLYQLLQKAAPGVPGIERMILDNVGHKGRKDSDLIDFIKDQEKEGNLTADQRDVLVEIAKSLRLKSVLIPRPGFMQRGVTEHNKNLSQFYTTLMGKAIDTQKMPIADQMEHLFTIQPGKSIMVHGGAGQARKLTITGQETKKVDDDGGEKRIIHLMSDQGYDAVLDPDAKKLTMQVGPSFVHIDLATHALKNGDDLTMIHLTGKEKARAGKKKKAA
jgi:hypothetical protein